jgi:hypothetical protein
MSKFASSGAPLWNERDLSPIPEELRLFARIEGLVGEEAALLAIPAEERKQHQRDRLHAIAQELDEIWDRLRERAERLGRHAHDETAQSHQDS